MGAWLWLLALIAQPACARAAPTKVDGRLSVAFLDVGQGDATLITSPTGKTVLIDGGPPEASDKLVARLRSMGHPIDLVLLSHRHADHLGGLTRVIEQVGARVFMDGTFPHPSPLYDHLRAALAARGVEQRTARKGARVDLGGGAVMTLLGPPEPVIRGAHSDVNANSVVARVDYGDFSLLLTGDSEAETERWLLASGEPLRARVVKVAHHGSRYSSTPEFIHATSAELAVISAGAGNDYHHPHPEAIERWRHGGARVMRTDLDGEVRVTSDGRGYTVTGEKAPAIGGAVDSADAGSGSEVGSVVKKSPTEPGDGPRGATTAGFVASRRSQVFHRSDCRAVMTIVPTNRISYASRDEAIASGRRPAEDCRP